MKKCRYSLCVLLFALLISSGTVYAASAPAKVRGLKAEAKNREVSLTWKVTENADGYMIYMKEPEDAAAKKIGQVRKGTKNSYTVSKLTNFKTYQFAVAAYKKKNGKVLIGNKSKAVKAVPTLPKLKAPKVETAVRKNKVTFTWKRVKHASGYKIFQRINSKYKLVADVKDTTATVNGLNNRKEYKFRICAYRTSQGHTVNGYYTKVSLTALSQKQQMASLTTAVTYEGHVVSKTTFKKLDSEGKVTVSAGTKVGYYYDADGKMIALLQDGTRVRANSSLVSSHGSLYVHHEPYSKDIVEYYVNRKHITSSTNWMLWINFYTQYCYIFNRKNNKSPWESYGIWPCATGVINHQTPRGYLNIVDKTYKFYFKNGYGAYGLYASFIDGSPADGNAIHSPRRHYDGRLMDPYGTIGFPMSSGCVRLMDENAKFVYENCPIGTRLYIF